MHADSEQTFDSLDEHLPHAADIAQASMPMGMFVAWCANMQLLSQELLARHEQLVTRIRMQDALGSELVVAVGGNLTADLFNPSGLRYMQAHYANYMNTYRQVFGPDCYAIEDNWSNYKKLATELTRLYMGWRGVGREPSAGLWGRLNRWLKR